MQGRPDATRPKATETTSSDNATAEIKSAETETKSDEQSISAQAIEDAIKLAESAGESSKADETRLADVKADDVKTETIKADAPKVAEKPDDSVTAATDARPDADVKKDQTRLPLTDKPVLAKPEPPKRTGQIAVFVSRKDGKLYVRREFRAAVRRAGDDRAERPAAGHPCVHRAGRQERRQPAALVGGLAAGRRSQIRRATRRGRTHVAPAQDDGAPVETKPVPVPNNAAEALDRINIPAEAMARITEALATGGSIVVSDQGIAGSGETGEGTDFIVSLR